MKSVSEIPPSQPHGLILFKTKHVSSIEISLTDQGFGEHERDERAGRCGGPEDPGGSLP